MKTASVLLVTSWLYLFHRIGASVLLPLIPHAVQKERRHLQEESHLETRERPRRRSLQHRRTSTVQVGALYHGYGTHYVDLWVGTPPQRQTVIVDTGSGVTAFPCSSCQTCGAGTYHTDASFMEGDSSTFSAFTCDQCQYGTCNQQTSQCSMSMEYEEGSSWKAFESQDLCYVGGPHNVALEQGDATTTSSDLDPHYASHLSFPLTFGCQTQLTGLFEKQLADGIMGLDRSSTSFWNQMFQSGKMGSQQQFSLCFSRPSMASRAGTTAGALSLGGAETLLHSSTMVYTERNSMRGDFFGVRVRAIYVRHADGGTSAKTYNDNAKVIRLDLDETLLNKGGVIVDSGTTDSYFHSGISSEFRAAFLELAGTVFTNNAQSLSNEALAKFPTILFQLSGDEMLNKVLGDDPNQVVGLAGDLDAEHPYDVIVALPYTSYMEQSAEGVYVARFYDDDDTGGLLGANTMLGHDVLFDMDRGLLGWAESTCDYDGLVASAGYQNVLTDQSSASSSAGSTDASDTSDGDDDGDDDDDSDGESSTENSLDTASPSDGVPKTLEGGSCSTSSCQTRVGVLCLLVLCVAIFAWNRRRQRKHRPDKRSYELAELELAGSGEAAYNTNYRTRAEIPIDSAEQA
eukprot:Nitzschia sp. Nitz4//scaffold15_size197535//194123//196009//NITZ4_001617-RA/size197535-processed-gene-0.317-mRNA-1//-1//CDS//3329537832//1056//frame0